MGLIDLTACSCALSVSPKFCVPFCHLKMTLTSRIQNDKTNPKSIWPRDWKTSLRVRSCGAGWVTFLCMVQTRPSWCPTFKLLLIIFQNWFTTIIYRSRKRVPQSWCSKKTVRRSSVSSIIVFSFPPPSPSFLNAADLTPLSFSSLLSQFRNITV